MKFIIEGSACILEGNAVITPVVAFWHNKQNIIMIIKNQGMTMIDF